MLCRKAVLAVGVVIKPAVGFIVDDVVVGVVRLAGAALAWNSPLSRLMPIAVNSASSSAMTSVLCLKSAMVSASFEPSLPSPTLMLPSVTPASRSPVAVTVPATPKPDSISPVPVRSAAMAGAMLMSAGEAAGSVAVPPLSAPSPPSTMSSKRLPAMWMPPAVPEMSRLALAPEMGKAICNRAIANALVA